MLHTYSKLILGKKHKHYHVQTRSVIASAVQKRVAQSSFSDRYTLPLTATNTLYVLAITYIGTVNHHVRKVSIYVGSSNWFSAKSSIYVFKQIPS